MKVMKAMKVNKKHIEFLRGHVVVYGTTRHGKTYTVLRSLLKEKVGVFLFNSQYETCPRGFIKADGSTSIEVIISALKKGKKINFCPALDEEKRFKQMIYIIDKLFRAGFDEDNYIKFVVDEIHLYDEKEVLRKLKTIPTGGLKFGLEGVWITQRPQNLHKTFVSQSTYLIFFRTFGEDKYFKGYNIPIEEINKRIDANGKKDNRGRTFSYCLLHHWSIVEGAYRI